MRGDAASGEFTLVLCWDQDRFGRFDPIEAGHWILPFRNAGVRLETVAQGRIDWNDLAGRLTYLVQQEGKYAFLRDLSRNVARGQMQAAKDGRGWGNRLPYGFRVEDNAVVVVEEQATVVRLIFREYLKPAASLRSVVTTLNGRSIPSAKGGIWTATTLKYVLETEKYTGSLVFGRQAVGRYHRCYEGQIVAGSKTLGKTAGTPIVHEGKLPVIIDRKTFDRVQQKLHANRTNTAPRSARCYPLSGLLRCGDCGEKMTGKGKQQRSKIHTTYSCRRFRHAGKTACYGHELCEAPVLAEVCRLIEERYLSDANLDRIRAAIVRRQHTERQTEAVDVEALRNRVADLERKIDHGAERVFAAPASLVSTLTKKLDDLRRQRDDLRSQLSAAERPHGTADAALRQEAEAAVEALRDLRTAFKGAAPEELKALFQGLIDRIDIKYSHEPNGKRVRHRLEGGTVFMRADSALSSVLFGTDYGSEQDRHLFVLKFTGRDVENQTRRIRQRVG
jgi:hypothetical protein